VISTAEEYAAEPDSYYTNQLENRDQVSGYRGMGRELLAQVPMGIDVFCGAVGTAGMLMGVATEFAPRAHLPGSSGWNRQRAGSGDAVHRAQGW
jgi:cysteine synthase